MRTAAMPDRKPRTPTFDLTRGDRARDAAPVLPIVDRGRLVYDFQIPDRYLGGLPKIGDKVRWVRTHLPRATRIKIGNDSAWYERDIEAWLASRLRDRGQEPTP